MPRAQIAIACGSLAAAGGLIWLLVHVSAVSLEDVLALLAHTDPTAALSVVAAMLAMAWCSGEKWRLIEGTRKPQPRPRSICFGYTAFGMLLGQLLPTPVSTAIARASGAALDRRSSPMRAAGDTVIDQIFDVVLVGTAAIPTLLALMFHLLPLTWIALMLMALPAAPLAATMIFSKADALQRSVATATEKRPWIAWVAGPALMLLHGVPSLRPRMVWRLFGWSAWRYAALVMGAWAVAVGTGLPIDFVQIAMAMPLVILAVVVSFAPGGLGVNEWTFAGALAATGVPLAMAVKFALLNRILNILGGVVVGLTGAATLAVAALVRRG